jgi:hypothetical protein
MLDLKKDVLLQARILALSQLAVALLQLPHRWQRETQQNTQPEQFQTA